MSVTTGVGALSERETQVLALIARGRTNAEIAVELGIGFETAKWHVSQILSELGVDSREEAANAWRAYNAPRMRVGRVLRALLPAAGWLKVGGALATVVVAASAVVFVVVSLKESGGNVPGAAATPTAVAPQQYTVQLVQGGGNAGPPTVTTLPFPSADSLAKVSAAANFPLTLPSYVPPGFQLTEIDIPARPPAAIDSSGLPFQAILKFHGANGGFSIEELSARISPPDDPNQIIATPAAGTRVFKDQSDLTTSYTLVTPWRLIELGTGAPNPLSDDDAVRILTSIP